MLKAALREAGVGNLITRLGVVSSQADRNLRATGNWRVIGAREASESSPDQAKIWDAERTKSLCEQMSYDEANGIGPEPSRRCSTRKLRLDGKRVSRDRLFPSPNSCCSESTIRT